MFYKFYCYHRLSYIKLQIYDYVLWTPISYLTHFVFSFYTHHIKRAGLVKCIQLSLGIRSGASIVKQI